jgi:transposase, IS5 family
LRGDKEAEVPNNGRLIIDATCTPADIRYPQDLGIVSEAREKSEKIIDLLYKQNHIVGERKPRTYRERARKDYLNVAKKRQAAPKTIRKAVKKQLRYLRRNLAHIGRLLDLQTSIPLEKKRHRELLIIQEVYRQQTVMSANNDRRIDNRIVSIHQPHVRPIVRGKARKNTEFGAKISISCQDGYVFLDRISWESYNESGDLIGQAEAYKERCGFYPESIHADKIYRTTANRAWCKERGIRLSGPPLGRPPKNIDPALKKQAQSDERVRNEVEGKFGVAKRRFSLDKVMTKLPKTSETAIAITFLVMNLSTLLRQIMRNFLSLILGLPKFSNFRQVRLVIFIKYLPISIKNYQLLLFSSHVPTVLPSANRLSDLFSKPY